MKVKKLGLPISLRPFLSKILGIILVCILGPGCSRSSSNDAVWLTRSALTASGTGNSSTINVAWTAQTPNQYYTVFRSTDPKASFQPVGTSTGTSFVDQSVNSGQIYYYRVGASDTGFTFLMPESVDGSTVRAATADCLSKASVRNLKSIQSISDLKKSLIQLYANCSTLLAGKLKLPQDETPFSDSELKMVYAMIVAHLMAPYGPQVAGGLRQLITQNTLACSDYAALTGDLYQLLAGDNYAENIYFAGFDGGAVGNHAQLVFVSSLRQFIIDPTTGIVAIINFKDLLNGVPASHVFSFYGYWDDPDQADGIDDFHWEVYEALFNGLYRTSDVIYFSPRVKDLNAFIDESDTVAFP